MQLSPMIELMQYPFAVPLVTLLYTAVHILPVNLTRLYIFRRYLRFAPLPIAAAQELLARGRRCKHYRSHEFSSSFASLHIHLFRYIYRFLAEKQPPSLAKRRGLLSVGCHFACFCSRIACFQLLLVYHALLLFSYQTLPSMNHRRFFALASSLALLARPMRRAQSRRRK